MRLPDLPAPGPSFAALFSRSAFSQRPFVDASEFGRLARDRGLDFDLFPSKQMKEMDWAGALCPIAFSQINYTVETTWLDPDPKCMIWREERNFEPWDNHAWRFPDDPDDRVHANVSERYSEWQLLYAEEALALTKASDSSRCGLDEEWRPFIKLLVALQSRLWPFRRQSTTLLHDATGSADRVDPLEVEVDRFSSSEILRAFELTLDALALLHHDLGTAARRLDPIPDWYRLSEIAPRRTTDAFRGTALRARDLYDACFLLRGLYHLATDQWLPRPDEETERSVEAWRRRHLPRATLAEGAGRAELQSVLVAQGLYPHLVHFVVEGDTEALLVDKLLKLTNRRIGFRVTNLRGVDKAAAHETLFESASTYAARTVLIADREGTLATVLRSLQADGLLTDPTDVLLWEKDGEPSSFEEANFSSEEIVLALKRASRKHSAEFELELSGDELDRSFSAALREAQSDGRPRPALGSHAISVARNRHAPVTKGELAAELVDITVKTVASTRSLVPEGGAGRPLLMRFQTWIVDADRARFR